MAVLLAPTKLIELRSNLSQRFGLRRALLLPTLALSLSAALGLLLPICGCLLDKRQPLALEAREKASTPGLGWGPALGMGVGGHPQSLLGHGPIPLMASVRDAVVTVSPLPCTRQGLDQGEPVSHIRCDDRCAARTRQGPGPWLRRLIPTTTAALFATSRTRKQRVSMQINGEWLLCDDGIVRPVIRGAILTNEGLW